MKFLYSGIVLCFLFVSCSPSGNNANETNEKAPDKKWVEGRDYTILERVRVMDATGFAQPVIAYSLLMPKGWKTEGGITWKVGNMCANESVSNRLTATSSDGNFVLDIFPVRSWEWAEDPMIMQGMQNNAAMGFKRCDIMPPVDATNYLKGEFANELGNPQFVSVEPNSKLSAILEEQAKNNTAYMRSAGINTIDYRPSAVIGKLKFADGSSGIALCSINQIVNYVPNFMTGGTSSSYQCSADQKVVMRCRAGMEEEAGKILSTMMSSIRINPQWQQAVQQVFSNIAKGEQAENAKRAAIWKQSQDDINKIHQETWEYQQQSNDRISEETGRVLRGVEQWTDPSTGSSLDLTSGYNEAWSKGDGTYILSNDPNFDPSVVLQEDWKRMEKNK